MTCKCRKTCLANEKLLSCPFKYINKIWIGFLKTTQSHKHCAAFYEFENSNFYREMLVCKTTRINAKSRGKRCRPVYFQEHYFIKDEVRQLDETYTVIGWTFSYLLDAAPVFTNAPKVLQVKENNQRGQIITNIHGHARSRWHNNASIKYTIIKGESREISIQIYLKLQRYKVTPIPITIRSVKEENFHVASHATDIPKLCSKIDPQHLLWSAERWIFAPCSQALSGGPWSSFSWRACF